MPTDSPGFFKIIQEKIFITKVPRYGNSIYYSLGFLGLVCFAILLVTGLVMVFMGSAWWLSNFWGIFFRSIHLWAAQAFVLIIFLHVLVVFSTSGFKPPRRLTWVLGAIVLLFLLLEAEFGYYLRGDFSSQYRALQGADFWNGTYLGNAINTLNHAQVFGIHVIIIPAIIIGLLFTHYLLVKARGIALPYRRDVVTTIVPANHVKLFLRGAALAIVIILLAIFFPSPFVTPAEINTVAGDNPALMGQTLIAEFTRTSDTATYLDSIDPYTFDTRDVYVTWPYTRYLAATGGPNELAAFLAEPPATEAQNIADAQAYFQNPTAVVTTGTSSPFLAVMHSLIAMGASGLYQAALDAEQPAINPTYSLRFLNDTGVLDDEANDLHITTEQWGMVREEGNVIPPGAWWLAPLGALDHTILANDPNGDRDGAEILGLVVLLLILFPYIPYLNRLPEKLHLARFFWNRK